MSITLKHDGLYEDKTRFDLLKLFKQVAKTDYQLSKTAIGLIEHCIIRTQDIDYKKGHICALWSQVSSISDDLMLTSRSINDAMRELEVKGFIKRTTGTNGARAGKRIGGIIEWAAGINLAPLINRYDELVERYEAKQFYKHSIVICRQEIRLLSKQIREQGEIEALEQILPRGRTSRINKLETLEDIKASLEQILEGLLSSGEQKTSDASEENFSPNILIKGNYKTVRQRESYENITPALIHHIADPEYKSIMTIYGGLKWNAVIETSYQLLPSLGIDQSIWGRACQRFGREIAATCIAIIHRNHKRRYNHPCHARSSQACLLGMINKHKTDDFNLTALLAATASHQIDK